MFLNLPPEMHISLCDDKGDIDRARRPWEIVPVGHKIGKPEPLFKELKFAGNQADKKEREEVEAVKVAAQLKKTKIPGLPTSLSILILENKPIYSQAA
ncbi:hypothetical protein Pyn_14250 [Prunus yedoensis var. nudiflora]|uniref:Uncharacterized protein n=1 Tax=Prunus yedoensis var. nudiflora TaxID=2094558 RepID=A0A314YF14_PRUYE|nr:hypothetical protein Pyn_14250 [Prunus yedoensis var. nudiflora]